MAIKKNHSKILGVDFDPKNDIELDVKPDGDSSVKYKGKKMDYNDYIDEIQDRCEKKASGKDFTSRSIGLFSGFGKGTLNK